MVALCFQSARRLHEKFDQLRREQQHHHQLIGLTTTTSSSSASASASGGNNDPSAAIMTTLRKGFRKLLTADITLHATGQNGSKRKSDCDEESKGHYSDAPVTCALAFLRRVCEQPGSGMTYGQVTACNSPNANGVMCLSSFLLIKYHLNTFCFNVSGKLVRMQ